jgi:hypothetical protein
MARAAVAVVIGNEYQQKTLINRGASKTQGFVNIRPLIYRGLEFSLTMMGDPRRTFP